MSYQLKKRNDVTYISFPILDKFNVLHGFTTREGGVSKGIYRSMNLGFTLGDDREDVLENHRRFAKAVGYEPESLVFSDQTHDILIRKVTKEDSGKGIFRERDYKGIDGLITDDENVTLITFYADCIPLFFCDPIKKVVGAAHSGWRGTVRRIGREMIQTMEEDYGCHKSDIVAVIGPGICKDCYEVSRDVAEKFMEEFDESRWCEILTSKENEKYQLDLIRANEIILEEAGLLSENIETSGLCTCCNPELLFSNRATGGKRGTLAGVISCNGL